MKLSEFKNILLTIPVVNFSLPDGQAIPSHFHITEAGLTTKQFVDCGGTMRADKTITLQVWVAGDTAHRLEPAKLLMIIEVYEKLFGSEDLETEIEYETDTTGKYGINFSNGTFMLTPKHTDCLAKDQCGVPKQKIKLTELTPVAAEGCCTPGGGCC